MQHPERKIGVMIMLSGRRGIGKSLLFEALRAIVPHAELLKNRGVNDLTEKFNSNLVNKTLYMLGESVKSSNTTAESIAALKSLITDSGQFKVELKGVDQQDVTLYHNYISASNFTCSVELEDADRRFCLIPNADATYGPENPEYWKKMAPLMQSTVFHASLQRYLLTRDISGFRYGQFPKHDTRNDCIKRHDIVDQVVSTPGYKQELLEFCKELIDGGSEVVHHVPTIAKMVEFYYRSSNSNPAALTKLRATLRSNFLENELLRKHMRLHPRGPTGIARMPVVITDCDGKFLRDEERDYAYPVYFTEDAGEVEVIDTPETKLAELQAIIDKMKAAMTASVESNDVSSVKECLEELYPDNVDYNKLNLVKLRSLLTERKIKGFTTKSKKAELIKLLNDADLKDQQRQ